MARTRAIAAPTAFAPRMDRLTAARLARRAAGGDVRAFETIFRRYHEELYRYCLGIVQNPADAEDALQATMAAALRALPGEERDVALRPWLYRVAHNESISLIRGRRESALGEVADELVESSAAVRAEQRERLRQLIGDLRDLPERQRSAILMRELNDLSYADIAAALGCSEGAARQTVYEARSALHLIAEGRAMDCEEARQAISADDRRRLRGRRVRSHLSACEGCQDFEAVIAQRRQDLSVLFPALPAAAAATLLSGLVGGGGGAAVAGTAAGTGGGALGAALGASAAMKGASALAAATLAVGAADLSGAIDVTSPFRGSDDGQSGGRSDGSDSAPAAKSPEGDSDTAAGGSAVAGPATAEGYADGGRSSSADAPGRDAPGQTKVNGKDSAPGQLGTAGKSEDAPGQTGTAGKSESAPGQTGTAGKSESAPGHTGTAGKSESAPGHTGTAGKSESAPGHTGTAGKSESAPGHTGTAGKSGSSNSGGNSASAPGQTGSPPPTSSSVPEEKPPAATKPPKDKTDK